MTKDIKAALSRRKEEIGEPTYSLVISIIDEATRPKDDGFDEAWAKYNKKVGKRPAYIAWKRLTATERGEALAHIPTFVKATPDKKYRPHFRAYIHQRRWEDEELPMIEDKIVPMTYYEMLLDSQKKGIKAGPPKYVAVPQQHGQKPKWLPA